MLPEKFMEQSIRVYCKKIDPDSIKAARKLVSSNLARDIAMIDSSDM